MLQNARWSLDFVQDKLPCGRRYHILTIVDDVTRKCLAAILDALISGRTVGRELTTLIERCGKPSMIVGPSRDIALQCPPGCGQWNRADH